MKAAVLNEPTGRFDIEDIAIDAPSGREVLVAVRASGLCHSDLHIATGNFGVPLPAVLGHELAGVVEAVGPDVSGFAIGDHVVGSLIACCGVCEPCHDHRTYQCDRPEATQRPAHHGPKLSRGGKPVTAAYGTAAFAEKALVHENQLARIPDAMPFPQAALLGCGVITGVGAVRNSAKVVAGETVVVIGAGGVGLNVVAGAKLCGAGRIIVVDAQPAKEALARRFGATDFIVATAGDPVAAVHALTGRGADQVFEVVGKTALLLQAVRMVRKGGSVNIIGIPGPGEKVEFEVLTDLIRRQVTIRGVYMGSSNLKEDVPRLAEDYLAGALNLDDLISDEIVLDDINAAYARLEGGSVARSVITRF